MCYRDMTFCDGANRTCAHFGTCNRALTDHVVLDASRQMASISQFTEPKKLECYEPKQQETK